MENQTPKKGFAIAGLVLGIVSVAAGYEAWYLGVAAGVVGLILSVQAKKSYAAVGSSNGMATAGFVLSIVGLAVSAAGLVTCITCAGCMAVAGSEAIAEGLAEGTLSGEYIPSDLLSQLDEAAKDLSSGLGEAASALAEASTEVANIL